MSHRQNLRFFQELSSYISSGPYSNSLPSILQLRAPAVLLLLVTITITITIIIIIHHELGLDTQTGFGLV
jgi:hypothetical protein